MTQPLTDRIADGIHRIPLALPLDDLKVINAYAFESFEGLVLVDPGWATPETERTLAAALRELGYTFRDVTKIIATHSHWDHYTQAIGLRDEFGARVYLGADERYSVDAFATLSGPYPRQVELLRAAGAPELAQSIETMAYRAHEIGLPLGAPDVWMHDGDVFDLGDRMLTVHETPGHTRGHVVISDATAGVMITGDHILPRITPSIGFEREPEAMPLGSFLSSLRATLRACRCANASGTRSGDRQRARPGTGTAPPSRRATRRDPRARRGRTLTTRNRAGAPVDPLRAPP